MTGQQYGESSQQESLEVGPSTSRLGAAGSACLFFESYRATRSPSPSPDLLRSDAAAFLAQTACEVLSAVKRSVAVAKLKAPSYLKVICAAMQLWLRKLRFKCSARSWNDRGAKECSCWLQFVV